MRNILIIRTTTDFGGSEIGCCGEYRKAVLPGHSFDGREGIDLQRGHNLGWWQPVGWWTAEEVARGMVDHWWWRYGQTEPYDFDEFVPFAGSFGTSGPDDFPGLREHYPRIAEAFGLADPCTVLESR